LICRLLTLVLALAPTIAAAAEETAKESFALRMLECAHKHKTFALGPGTATAVAQADKEALKYVTAAVKVTSAEFVEQRSPEIKSAAQKAVVKEFQSSQSVVEIKARWADTISRCDAALIAPVE